MSDENGSRVFYLNYSDFNDSGKNQIPVQIFNFTKHQLRNLVELLNQGNKTVNQDDLVKGLQEFSPNTYETQPPRIEKNDFSYKDKYFRNIFLKPGKISDDDLKNIIVEKIPNFITLDEKDRNVELGSTKSGRYSHAGVGVKKKSGENLKFLLSQYSNHNSTEKYNNLLQNVSKWINSDILFSNKDEENIYRKAMDTEFEYEIPSVAIVGDGKHDMKVNLITPRPIIVKKDLTDSNFSNLLQKAEDKFFKINDYELLNYINNGSSLKNDNNNNILKNVSNNVSELMPVNVNGFPFLRNRFPGHPDSKYASDSQNSFANVNDEKNRISFNLELKAKLPIHSSPFSNKSASDIEYTSDEQKLRSNLRFHDDNFSEKLSDGTTNHISVQKRQNIGNEKDKLSDIKLKILFEAVMPDENKNKLNDQGNNVSYGEMVFKDSDEFKRKAEENNVNRIKIPLNILSKRAVERDPLDNDMTFKISLDAKIPQKFLNSVKSRSEIIPNDANSYKAKNLNSHDNLDSVDQDKNLIEVIVVKNNLNSSDLHNNKLTENGEFMKNAHQDQSFSDLYSNGSIINGPQHYDSIGKNIFRIKLHPNVTENRFESTSDNPIYNLSLDNVEKQQLNYSDKSQEKLFSDIIKGAGANDKKVENSNQNYQFIQKPQLSPFSSTIINRSDEQVLNQIRTLNNTLTKLVNELKSDSPSFRSNEPKQVMKKDSKGNHRTFPFSPIFQQFGVRFSNANDTNELVLKE